MAAAYGGPPVYEDPTPGPVISCNFDDLGGCPTSNAVDLYRDGTPGIDELNSVPGLSGILGGTTKWWIVGGILAAIGLWWGTRKTRKQNRRKRNKR